MEQKNTRPISIKVLILPKFEVGEITGDVAGEAQHYYDAYLKQGQAYEITGSLNGEKLYVKDGVALYLTGMGKVNAAMSLLTVLSDPRFDFSKSYFLSTGCGGGAWGRTVMGDVIVITACIDYDMGHTVDSSELTNPSRVTWFYDASFEGACCKLLDRELTDRVYERVKDIRPKTTPRTRHYMANSFKNGPWATRDPQVLRGTTATGDNYWKGFHGHDNAVRMVETYGCPDPFSMSEMEDGALAIVLDRLGMLDRLIVIRGVVNMDVFMQGTAPETLWNKAVADSLSSGDSDEGADIVPVAMENIFAVGSRIVDAILQGTL